MISLILGFLTSFLPDLLKLFKDKADYGQELALAKLESEQKRENMKYELALLAKKADVQMDAASQQHLFNMARDELNLQVKDIQSARRHDSSIKGNDFTETLRASVRPIITYSFFILFVVVKVVALTAALDEVSFAAAMLLVWDPFTQEIFGGIIGFWFGDRTRRSIHSKAV